MQFTLLILHKSLVLLTNYKAYFFIPRGNFQYCLFHFQDSLLVWKSGLKKKWKSVKKKNLCIPNCDKNTLSLWPDSILSQLCEAHSGKKKVPKLSHRRQASSLLCRPDTRVCVNLRYSQAEASRQHSLPLFRMWQNLWNCPQGSWWTTNVA